MNRIFLLALTVLLIGCDRSDEDALTAKAPEVLNSLIALNPNLNTPLSARFEAETDIPTTAAITVKGQDGEDLEYAFNTFASKHVIPVYGLYPDAVNQVQIVLTSKSGRKAVIEKEVTTGALSLDASDLKYKTLKPEKIADGFTLVMLLKLDGLGWVPGGYPVMIDRYGKIRWAYTGPLNHIFKPLKNGHYILDGGGTLREMDLLGTVYSTWNVAEGVHHDAVELPDGNILVLSSASGSVDDAVAEIDRLSGKVTKKWDLRDILDRQRPAGPVNGLAEDWLHLNGLAYDASDDCFIISGRNQSAVVKISRKTDAIQWILGNHGHWKPAFAPYLLTPSGDGFEWQWGQHCPVLHPDDPNRILIFDNGCDRSYDSPVRPQDNYSRAVEYVVDPVAKTIRQTWTWGKKMGAELYASYIGSVQYTENGNILICFGGIVKTPDGQAADVDDSNIRNSVRIIEVDPATNVPVMDLSVAGASAGDLSGYRSYRAYKIQPY